jgi:enamine deaminase RidA (YjgF/YER057c/UK114 family)
MEFFVHEYGEFAASVCISCFRGARGLDEYHLIVCPTEYGRFDLQLGQLFRAYGSALDSLGLDEGTAVFRRFFCSDVANQVGAFGSSPWSSGEAGGPCAVSCVGQPPAPPAKVALWAYHVRDSAAPLERLRGGLGLTVRRGPLSHHWTTGITSTAGRTSYEQTRGIFQAYDAMLRERDLHLADHVIRTWLFVRDIDANYEGLVVARREWFAERGLTPDTHFIASSGIEGGIADPAAMVAMDAYAISGVRREQIAFLKALEHLSPTHIYGVTFERGTSVAYRDRKQIFISGTASVDHRGEILYPGNIGRQLDRTLENVEALLASAGAGLQDMGVFVVYVRDVSDQAMARERLRARLGDAPVVVLAAPVCRPGWLVEVEGMAVVPAANPALPAF